MTYQIGAFSAKVGLSADTLRFYEKEQLIQPAHNAAGRRIYTEKDIAWIAFIKRLKQTAMPLKSIKRYAILRYQGNETIPERRDLLNQQLAQLLAQQAELQNHIDFLKAKIITYQQMQ